MLNNVGEDMGGKWTITLKDLYMKTFGMRNEATPDFVLKRFRDEK